MCNSGNDQTPINCQAVDCEVIREFLRLFKPVFDDRGVDQLTGLAKKSKPPSQIRRGQEPRDKVDAVGVVGMVPSWNGTCRSSARAASLALGLSAAPHAWMDQVWLQGIAPCHPTPPQCQSQAALWGGNQNPHWRHCSQVSTPWREESLGRW